MTIKELIEILKEYPEDIEAVKTNTSPITHIYMTSMRTWKLHKKWKIIPEEIYKKIIVIE